MTASVDSKRQFVWQDGQNQTVSYDQRLELPSLYSDDHPPDGVQTFRCGLLYDASALWSQVKVKVTKPPSFTITRHSGSRLNLAGFLNGWFCLLPAGASCPA